MANNEVESGLELVLDNRKLIVAFALLIAICGCFFVVGFIEGKRQGVQEGNLAATETAPKPVPAAEQLPPETPVKEEAKPAAPEVTDQPLDWYKNVKGESQPAAASSAPETAVSPAKPSSPTETRVVVEKPRKPLNPESATYSVQVGAFQQKNEMERKAEMLREKGFEPRTESPSEPGQFYLLKVGKFRTRAEASSMQLRLKREGIASFIKTN